MVAPHRTGSFAPLAICALLIVFSGKQQVLAVLRSTPSYVALTVEGSPVPDFQNNSDGRDVPLPGDRIGSSPDGDAAAEPVANYLRKLSRAVTVPRSKGLKHFVLAVAGMVLWKLLDVVFERKVMAKEEELQAMGYHSVTAAARREMREASVIPSLQAILVVATLIFLALGCFRFTWWIIKFSGFAVWSFLVFIFGK